MPVITRLLVLAGGDNITTLSVDEVKSSLEISSKPLDGDEVPVKGQVSLETFELAVSSLKREILLYLFIFLSFNTSRGFAITSSRAFIKAIISISFIGISYVRTIAFQAQVYMTMTKKATFSGKTQLVAKYIVSGADGCGNRAIDIKRRDRSGLPQSL